MRALTIAPEGELLKTLIPVALLGGVTVVGVFAISKYRKGRKGKKKAKKKA